jgi:mannose-1-phosphate guanylyltransferase
MTMNKHHYVAIMAGGIGSRFWPMSRSAQPKQFLDILGIGKTLIQETFNRYSKLVPVENIYIVTARDYVPIVREQLRCLPEENILAEPSRKNTAACIAYIAFKLYQKDPDAIMIAAPSDNHITDEDIFSQSIKKAFEFAGSINGLVTIGIKPTSPNTGYGYIQHEAPEAAPGVHKVKAFTEKPDLALAEAFVASGDFLWNAGIFTWRVKNILTAFEKYLPEIYELFAAERKKLNTPEEANAIENIYPQCTSISIDFGIMEKADNVFVIPATFSWSDLGTWNSAWDNTEKDDFQNAVTGHNVMVVDAKNCVVNAPDNKLVFLQGTEDFIIVDTNDVLMICKREKEQEIKEYVAEIKRHKGDKFL